MNKIIHKIKLLNKIKLSTKLWFWTMGLVISVIIINSVITYYHSYSALEEKSQKILQNAVVMAIDIAEIQHRVYLEGDIDLESAKSDVLKLLSDNHGIDLGKSGYFVVLDSKGKILSHPYLSGQDGYDMRDESRDEVYFVREAIEVAKRGGGFTYFDWHLPSSDKRDQKVIYSLYYEPWDWVIQATAYMSDYNESAMSILSEMIKVFFIMVIFIFVIVHLFVDDVMRPIKKTIDAMLALEEGEYTIIADEDRIDELGLLIGGYNHMALAMQENQESLLLHNEELEEANREIQALYEQMLASEEMLKYNYDELANYREALETEKENYRKILIASNEAYWEYDFEKKEVTVTNFTKDMSSFTMPLEQFLLRVHPEDTKEIVHYFSDNDRMASSIFETKIRLIVNETVSLYHWFQLLCIREENSIFGSMTDIQNDVINKERIEFYAFHDSVLGLYNMDFLNDVISNSVLQNFENNKYVLLVIGVVGYDRILNAYGKNLTDIMNFQLSAEINFIFSNAKYISTLHSGRFAVWMQCVEQTKCSESEIKRLEQSIKNQVGTFSNIEMPVNLAYGAILIDEHHKDNSGAISEAETAFEYAANKGVFHQIQWYDDSLKVKKDRGVTLEQHLLKAIERNELYLVYQPQYASNDKQEIFGYEALIRWNSDELGQIPPGEFIPLAESIDYINQIGRFVINEAIRFISQQKQNGRHIHVSINASYKELLQNDYVSYLLGMLESNGLEIEQLNIEITETTISEYIDIVLEKLNTLIECGFQIHMDDFGTGYSSLYQLGRMPFHILKIDKSFVWALETDAKMRAMTQLIIDMAHRIDMKIIAEGVETQMQYQLLEAMSCDYYQGYLLSKPLLASEIS